MIYLFKIKKNIKKTGFTLIEILVSISLLSIIIISISGIYFNISNNQKELSAESFVHSDLEYFLRIFSNNVRWAEISDGNKCGIAQNAFFTFTSENNLTFIKDNECLTFSFVQNSNIGGVTFNKPDFSEPQLLTSSHTNISNLRFAVEDNISLGQPIVTIYVKANPVSNATHYIESQTSISINY